MIIFKGNHVEDIFKLTDMPNSTMVIGKKKKNVCH